MHRPAPIDSTRAQAVEPKDEQPRERAAALALAALGVVYGDIGTSPLYAIKEVFANSDHPVPITADNVLGALSLVFWSLIVVVSFKYVVLIMRADNKGEGGIMALMALVLGQQRVSTKTKRAVVIFGLFGAALFYGDGVITPAISVLSAVEGLEVATPAFREYIVPITIAILVALFMFQKRGTATVGVAFGPITALWFVTLAALGVAQIVDNPHVLRALSPRYAVGFLMADPMLGFLSLGAVFLVVTGAEALYADMGHFGRRPIRLAWFGLVLPSLLLNYFGQGALLLQSPAAIQNPFYLMAPSWALYPMVALATAATVIASQAVISGAYSITHQAIQLGYSPRMIVQHTSSARIGQIYLPSINWSLLGCIIFLVLLFKSSTNLAAAYGIAVTGTMIITTAFAFIIARQEWRWSAPKALAIFGGLLIIDVAFLAANSAKIQNGGWFPLVFGMVVFTLLATWKRGQELLGHQLDAHAMPLRAFIDSVEQSPPTTVPGTAVFMAAQPDRTPHALLHSLKHVKSLHERVAVVTVSILPMPRIEDTQRLVIERLSRRFFRVEVAFGFMEEPDVPAALKLCHEKDLPLDPMQTSFFLGRETILPRVAKGMTYWRKKLFVAMFRNAADAPGYFKLPPNRVVELGAQFVL